MVNYVFNINQTRQKIVPGEYKLTVLDGDTGRTPVAAGDGGVRWFDSEDLRPVLSPVAAKLGVEGVNPEDYVVFYKSQVVEEMRGSRGTTISVSGEPPDVTLLRSEVQHWYRLSEIPVPDVVLPGGLTGLSEVYSAYVEAEARNDQ